MAEIHRSTFEVHSYDVDAFGGLCPRSLAGFLQESAARSADSMGFGLGDLVQRGLTWVLVREHFVLDEPIRLGDVVAVETWPSGVSRRAALRDFRLLKKEREIGRALTSWLVLDLSTRRAVRPQDVLPEAIHGDVPHVLPVSADSLAAVDSALVEQKFHVRYSDIDVNLHVTNASYIEWVAETIGEDTWRGQWLRCLDIQFISECSLGSRVISRSMLRAGQMLHSIIREHDSKELARARTVWSSR